MNGLLIVDKPSGITSHDVVKKVRKLTRFDKIGHTGTLDPLATGILVLCLGKATRLTQFLQQDVKEYLVGVTLGLVTDSQDITGRPLTKNQCQVKRPQVEKILSQFKGRIKQVPPMASAIKVNGQPLYKLARQGKQVGRHPREVEIYNLELLEFNSKPETNFLLKVACSKGAYMRTLAHDIGKNLGCGGCLSSLRRTRCGDFALEQARTLQEIGDLKRKKILQQSLVPLSKVLPSWPILRIKEKSQPKVAQGALLTDEMVDSLSSSLKKGQYFKVVNSHDHLLAIAEATQNMVGKQKNIPIAKWICVLI